MKCNRCGKDVDIDKEVMYGVYVYPQEFSAHKQPKNKKLPKIKDIRVPGGDFSLLSKMSYCADCARSINMFSRSLDFAHYDTARAKNLSDHGFTIQEIALDLNCPKNIVSELIRSEEEKQTRKGESDV